MLLIMSADALAAINLFKSVDLNSVNFNALILINVVPKMEDDCREKLRICNVSTGLLQPKLPGFFHVCVGGSFRPADRHRTPKG